jgi:hypothetical protein
LFYLILMFPASRVAKSERIELRLARYWPRLLLRPDCASGDISGRILWCGTICSCHSFLFLLSFSLKIYALMNWHSLPGIFAWRSPVYDYDESVVAFRVIVDDWWYFSMDHCQAEYKTRMARFAKQNTALLQSMDWLRELFFFCFLFFPFICNDALGLSLRVNDFVVTVCWIGWLFSFNIFCVLAFHWF